MQPFIFNAPQSKNDPRRQAIIAQIMGQGQAAPQTVGQGIGQGMNSLMGGCALRNHNRGPFPDAPGGAKPNMLQGLMNFFGQGGGGLY